jgi:hypothetical protein
LCLLVLVFASLSADGQLRRRVGKWVTLLLLVCASASAHAHHNISHLFSSHLTPIPGHSTIAVRRFLKKNNGSFKNTKVLRDPSRRVRNRVRCGVVVVVVVVGVGVVVVVASSLSILLQRERLVRGLAFCWLSLN